MEISDISMYLDGGTLILFTNKGDFCIDKRIKSTNHGRLYNKYPLKDNSNLIENDIELKNEILEASKLYDGGSYYNEINELFKNK